jgi:plasmid stability protein
MARQLTVRGVSEEVGRRLETLSKTHGKSVNRLILEILEAAVGVDRRRERLKRYVTWTEQDLREFEEALASQRVIDDELWR